MRFRNETHAWVMWCMNYIDPKIWMGELWGGSYLYAHFMGKFELYYERSGSDGVMNAFYCSMSDNHQDELRDWVMNHYAQDNWAQICDMLRDKYYPKTK